MTGRVVITSQLPEEGLSSLESFLVTSHPSRRPRTEQELIELFREADGVITLVSDPVSRRVLQTSPSLKIVANYAVGTNNIDLEAATSLGIVVTNTPDVLTSATADLTMALMLAVTRRVVEGDQMVREGHFHGWHPLLLLGTGLEGKTLGIIGPGRIGKAVATRALGFGMEVVFSGRFAQSADPALGARSVSLSELLSISDIVTIHAPLTAETKRLMDGDKIASMKRSAFLINTARGEIVDEHALAKALENGRLAGAGLDVFEHEPEIVEQLKTMRNVVLLPHIGSATVEARTAMARIASAEVAAVLSGGAPRYPVVDSRTKGDI